MTRSANAERKLVRSCA